MDNELSETLKYGGRKVNEVAMNEGMIRDLGVDRVYINHGQLFLLNPATWCECCRYKHEKCRG